MDPAAAGHVDVVDSESSLTDPPDLRRRFRQVFVEPPARLLARRSLRDAEVELSSIDQSG